TTLINIHEEGTIQDPDDFITNGAYPNSAYDDMGGLIGLLVNSNISNSSIKCHINFYGGGRVGGLAGMIAGSTISNCTSFIKTTAPSSKTIPQSRSSMPLAKTGPK
ncbi:MAG: hypothetical protein IJ268_00185, partial [Proteobacteria bacterium]|nr:hypothetical protein [Pseudomonadota bacterium]